MMAQMMQQMQSQQAEIATMQRMQAQAQIDALNRADQSKADAAEAAALAAAHAPVHHNGWWELGHFAVAAAPVVMTALSIYNGKPIDGKTAALYQLGYGISAPYFSTPTP